MVSLRMGREAIRATDGGKERWIEGGSTIVEDVAKSPCGADN